MWYDLTSQLLPRPDWHTSSTIRWRSSTPLRLCVPKNRGDFLSVFEFCKRFGILGDWVFTPTDLSDETLECWPAGGLKTKPHIGNHFLHRVFLNPIPSFPELKIGQQAIGKKPIFIFGTEHDGEGQSKRKCPVFCLWDSLFRCQPLVRSLSNLNSRRCHLKTLLRRGKLEMFNLDLTKVKYSFELDH